jgi:hypothetical protein
MERYSARRLQSIDFGPKRRDACRLFGRQVVLLGFGRVDDRSRFGD